MEFKCAHCKKSFEKTDLDDFSKKQLESFLKEIEQSLHQELEKQITNKYKEELKQFEEEKKATYLHFGKEEREIEDNEETSWEIKELKKKIEKLRIKKMELEEDVVEKEPTKNDYNKWAKEVENTKKQINDSIKTIKSSLNLIKKVILKELSYFDPSIENPFKSFLLKISWKDKVKEMTLDVNHKYLEHDKEKKILIPFSYHKGKSLVCYSSLDEVSRLYNSKDSKMGLSLEVMTNTIILNNIYSKLQPIVKELERKVPFLKRIMFKQDYHMNSYAFLYGKLGVEEFNKNKGRKYVNFLDVLMQKLAWQCLITHYRKAYSYIEERKEIQKVKKVKEELENFPIASKKIELYKKKYNQLKKDEELLKNKLESIKKKLEKMRF